MSFISQVTTVVWKNFSICKRSKEFLAQSYIPIVCSLFSVFSKRFSNPQETGFLHSIAISLYGLLPFYASTALNGFVRFMSMQLATDQSDRQRDVQKIMGLSQSAYMAGTLISSYLIALLLSLLYLVPGLIGGIWDDTDLTSFEVVISYFIFVCSLVNQIFLISSFFNSPKLASDIVSILTMVFSFAYFLVFVEDFRNSGLFVQLLSVFPASTINNSWFSQGWWFYGMLPPDAKEQFGIKYNFTENVICLIVGGVVNLIVFLYIDQIWPNQFGTQKKPLFFLQCFKRGKDSSNSIYMKPDSASVQIQLNENQISQGHFQLVQQEQNVNIMKIDSIEEDFIHGDSVGNTIKYQKFTGENRVGVKIRNLQKKFNGTAVVDQLSLDLYQGQIFCLLGHNGAGKSTTVNLLTGMVNPTSGQVQMYGLDFVQDSDKIRKNTGICNQRDILYDFITVEEHLEFYARIQGIPENEIKKDVDFLVQQCGLHNERNQCAIHLSGGNRRQLSLAIALTGQSRLIFLDEPTSGIDPVSRKHIWDILLQFQSQNRVIVLITHHYQEAEALADRLAIMSQGKVLTVGSVQFVTKEFGSGYHLRIFPKNAHPEEGKDEQEKNSNFNINKKQITQIVSNYIPGAMLDPQTLESSIQFTLPFSSLGSYAQLFEKLEEFQDISMNIEMNTLEDAFINSALEEDALIYPTQRIRETQSNSQIQTTKFSNFSNIEAPAILHNPPIYDLQCQISGIFQRRFKALTAEKSNLLSLILPFAFVILGLICAGDRSKNEQFAVNTFQFFVCFAYCLIASTFAFSPVSEKQNGIKYLLRVSGCRSSAYWLGTFLADLVLAISVSLAIQVISWTFDIIRLDEIVVYFIMMILFAIDHIIFSYLMSFLFETVQSTWMAMPFILLFSNLLGSFILLLITIGLKYRWLQLILMVYSPFYNLVLACMFIPQDQNDSSFISTDYQFYIAGMIVQTFIFAGIILSIQKGVFRRGKKVNPGEGTMNGLVQNTTDPEVYQQYQKLKMDLNINDPLKVKAINQSYENSKVTALNSISFSVPEQSIFGLLGPNGAGQSTSFNICSGQINPTFGEATLQNQRVDEFDESIWTSVGLCPQQDCLWLNLTPTDHLTTFAELQGLKGQDLDDVVNYFLNILNLKQHAQKKSKNLSGGNKRKLSVALALIGSPDVQYFDEPSSGLDPIAKRFLWQSLRENLNRRNGAIVLTTHSMNQAESLCSKIGIIINGGFACLGSPQHLSQRFGNGFRLSVKFDQKNPQNLESLKKTLLEFFQGRIIFVPEQKIDVITVQIPIVIFIFSQVFGFIHSLQSQNKILDYSIHNATLDQIFAHFSSFQFVADVPAVTRPDIDFCNCRGVNCLRWFTLCCCCWVW